MNLKIEYVNIDDLKTYENNAKLHPADQVEQIKKSIQQFGMNDPIAVWKDNVIIEGHGRLIACKELGFTELPVVRLDNLTDEQRRAYTLAHNKLTMNSGFDFDVLADELDSITDIDMSDFGFIDMSDFFKDDEFEEIDGNGANYKESISVVVKCESEFQAQELFEKLKEDGYECHISTL